MPLLRSLKNPHILPILEGIKVTTTVAPSVTMDIGDELMTPTRTGAGTVTAVLKSIATPCRAPVIVCSPGANIAQGGTARATIAGAMTAGLAGTGDDGTGTALIWCWNDISHDRCEPQQNVKNGCCSPRLLPFKLSSAGVVNIGLSQGANTLAGSIHTVVLDRPFSRDCVVVATPINAAVMGARVTASAATGFSIEGYDPAGGALANTAMYAAVLGWDSPDVQSALVRAVKVPQIAPRVELFYFDGAAGTISVGGEDATLTVNGAGDYTLTFTRPFAREPIVLVTAANKRGQCLAAATTTTCHVGAFEHSGGAYAAGHDEMNVVVIGFDSSDAV